MLAKILNFIKKKKAKLDVVFINDLPCCFFHPFIKCVHG